MGYVNPKFLGGCVLAVLKLLILYTIKNMQFVFVGKKVLQATI